MGNKEEAVVDAEVEAPVDADSVDAKTEAGLIENAFLLGLGAATATANAVQGVTKTLVDQGRMTQEQASKFGQDLARRADQQTKSIQAAATGTGQRAAGAVGFATKEDIARLEGEIDVIKDILARMVAESAAP